MAASAPARVWNVTKPTGYCMKEKIQKYIKKKNKIELNWGRESKHMLDIFEQQTQGKLQALHVKYIP